MRFRLRESMPALLLIIAASLGQSLGPAPAHAAVIWHDIAGAQRDDEGIQALAFLPNDLTIDVGDTISWTVPTGEFHTITFAAAANTPNTEPQKCNGTLSNTDQCTWDGTSEVNSGRKQDGGSYSITFTTGGTFAFRCLLHRKMTGTVRVQPASITPPHDQAYYDDLGASQAAALIRQGNQQQALGQRQAGAGPGKADVTIGDGGPVTTTSGGLQAVSVDRFLPGTLTVRVGDTVTFTASDANTPHTVTFGAEPGNPNPPIGLTGPGEATTLTSPYPHGWPPPNPQGATVSSGFLGDSNPAWNGSTFAVTFNAPGIYQYYCALHDDLGMLGTIRVQAKGGAS